MADAAPPFLERLRSPARRDALDATRLLDAPAEPALDRLTRLAARLLRAPIAVVALVDDDRQFFASCVGLPEPWATARETPLSHSFCLHVAATGAPLVVADARVHPLVRENLAVRDLGVVAYLGVPLVTPDAQVLGTLAVIDRTPRPWTDEEQETLTELAASVMTEIALRAEVAARRTSEARYRALFASVDVGFCVLQMLYDASGAPVDYRFLEANAAFEEHTGLVGVVGRTARAVVPNLEAHWIATYARVVATGEPLHFESGSEALGRWFDVHAVRVGGPEDRQVALVFTDVSVERSTATERERLLEALRHSEARFRLAAEATRDMIFDLDVASGHVVRDGAVWQILGRHASDIAPTMDAWAALVHPDDRGQARRALEAALADGRETLAVEYRMLRADGGVAHVHARACIVRDAAGAACRVVGAVTDLTERQEAEAALRASEARFRGFVEAAHEGVWAVDATGRTTYVNHRLAEMLGYAPADVVGRPMFDFMDPEAAFRKRTLFARRQRGIAETHEIAFRRADGSELWALVSSSPLRAPSGAFTGALSLISDLTARKQAERLAARQAAVLERIAAGHPLGEVLTAIVRLIEAEAPEILGSVLRIDPDGRRLYHGAAPSLPAAYCAAIDGLEIGPDAGSCGTAAHTRATVVVEDVQTDRRWNSHRELAEAHGLRSCWSTPILAPDGTLLGTFALYRRTPGRPSDVHGQLIAVATHLLGIALERAHAEEARARSERRFRALIEQAHDVVAILGADGIIQYESPAVERMLAFRPEEMVGRPASEFVHPDDLPAVRAALAEVSASSAGFARMRCRARHKHGGWRTVDAIARNMASDPAVGGIVVNARDVTEERALEAQLRQAQKMEAVGQLAGGVAHDFNNLLMVISGATAFARESLAPGSAARRDLAEVDEAVRRASALTRQLLAFSRKQLLQPVVLELNKVVQSVAPMLRRLIGEDIAVLTVPAPALHPVLADPGQLEQVLLNLAVNARDAMPRGGQLLIETANVTLTAAEAAQRAPAVPPGEYVRLTVRDTGVGMDAATLAQIFEPFFTTKEPGKGTGLGLSTVYGIVTQSGGYVSVSSTPGAGTTFEIDLPVSAAAPLPAEEADNGPALHPPRAGTVLVVEDEAAVRALVRRILVRQGYTVLEAAHGREALQVAAEHAGRLDVVLTDVVMPELSGRAFAEQLTARHPGVRVLFMSGYTDDDILRRGLLTPGMRLLEKPFTAERLLAAVADALDLQAP